MVNNVRIKAKLLERQYRGDPHLIPNNVLTQTFNPHSLEVALEHRDYDLMLYGIYKEAVREVLSEDSADLDFPVVKGMQRIKMLADNRSVRGMLRTKFLVDREERQLY